MNRGSIAEKKLAPEPASSTATATPAVPGPRTKAAVPTAPASIAAPIVTSRPARSERRPSPTCATARTTKNAEKTPAATDGEYPRNSTRNVGRNDITPCTTYVPTIATNNGRRTLGRERSSTSGASANRSRIGWSGRRGSVGRTRHANSRNTGAPTSAASARPRAPAVPEPDPRGGDGRHEPGERPAHGVKPERRPDVVEGPGEQRRRHRVVGARRRARHTPPPARTRGTRARARARRSSPSSRRRRRG